jgi:hypothetical protein
MHSCNKQPARRCARTSKTRAEAAPEQRAGNRVHFSRTGGSSPPADAPRQPPAAACWPAVEEQPGVPRASKAEMSYVVPATAPPHITTTHAPCPCPAERPPPALPARGPWGSVMPAPTPSLPSPPSLSPPPPPPPPPLFSFFFSSTSASASASQLIPYAHLDLDSAALWALRWHWPWPCCCLLLPAA